MRAFRLFIAYSYVPDFYKEVGDFFWESEVCVEFENMDLDNMLYRGLDHTCSGAIVFAICAGFSR